MPDRFGTIRLSLHYFNLSLLNIFSDKTLNLLKTGMKAFSQKLNTSVQLDSAYLSFTSQSLSLCQLKSVPNLKQMLLNNNLQLEVSNEIINVSILHI